MMYVLCKTPPSAKRVPLVYEMDRRGICPVCGEAVKTSMFDLAMKKIVYTTGHVVSNDPDSLMSEKSLFYFYRRNRPYFGSKGATT